jgi:hypothetical protein
MAAYLQQGLKNHHPSVIFSLPKEGGVLSLFQTSCLFPHVPGP